MKKLGAKKWERRDVRPCLLPVLALTTACASTASTPPTEITEAEKPSVFVELPFGPVGLHAPAPFATVAISSEGAITIDGTPLESANLVTELSKGEADLVVIRVHGNAPLGAVLDTITAATKVGFRADQICFDPNELNKFRMLNVGGENEAELRLDHEPVMVQEFENTDNSGSSESAERHDTCAQFIIPVF